MSIKVTPEEFAKDLRARLEKLSKQGYQAAKREASANARRLLARRTPVDTGQLKNSWHVNKEGVRNDAPHAGVIEKGARPHKVNRQGIESLTAWAMRQLGVGPEQAKAVAWGIAKRLEARGQEGTYFVENSIPDIARALKKAVERQIRKQAKGRVR